MPAAATLLEQPATPGGNEAHPPPHPDLGRSVGAPCSGRVLGATSTYTEDALEVDEGSEKVSPQLEERGWSPENMVPDSAQIRPLRPSGPCSRPPFSTRDETPHANRPTPFLAETCHPKAASTKLYQGTSKLSGRCSKSVGPLGPWKAFEGLESPWTAVEGLESH